MRELVYDAGARPFILETFPHAKVTDASDEIHEGRFEVELPDADRDAFYRDAIRKGYSDVCFGFQLMLRGGRARDMEQIREWLLQIKRERDGERVTGDCKGGTIHDFDPPKMGEVSVCKKCGMRV